MTGILSMDSPNDRLIVQGNSRWSVSVQKTVQIVSKCPNDTMEVFAKPRLPVAVRTDATAWRLYCVHQAQNYE
eukprot:scaffold235183_cov44-Prasinocladus_malaysianus.AAC.1